MNALKNDHNDLLDYPYSMDHTNAEILRISRERNCCEILATMFYYFQGRPLSRPVERFEFWIEAIKKAKNTGTFERLSHATKDDVYKGMTPEIIFGHMCLLEGARKILVIVAPTCDVVEFDNFPSAKIENAASREYRLHWEVQEKIKFHTELAACLSKRCIVST